MNPDFLINQRSNAEGVFYIVTPTHTAALNWMLDRVQPRERRSLSAHLDFDRLQEFKSEAALAGMTAAEPKQEASAR